jgi:hypothetical protein
MTDKTKKDRSNLSLPFRGTGGVFWASVACLAYFVTASLTGAYRADFPLIGVFIELLTIPAFFLAVACFVFSLILWSKNQYNVFSKPFYALLVLSGLVLFFIFI